jgi:DNA-binding transcriptional LysR family regulator
VQLSQIDLNLFTVFDAIYRERGITAASKRLHLSQPAVSHALARLRELLGDPLFERHGNEMIPTPHARELADTINHSLGDLEKLLQGGARFDPTVHRRSFTIAMRDAHETTFLPPMLDALHTAAPHISVATVKLERRELEEDLQSGDLDLAVDMALPTSTEICRQRVHAEPLVVLARSDHPSIRGVLDLPTYLSAEHVLVTGRRRGGGFEDAALQRLNLTRQIRVRCQQHAAACEVVKRSDLLATMPRSYAEHANRLLHNQMLPFPVATPEMELFIYWHVNVNDDPAHRWLRDLALKFIQ